MDLEALIVEIWMSVGYNMTIFFAGMQRVRYEAVQGKVLF